MADRRYMVKVEFLTEDGTWEERKVDKGGLGFTFSEAIYWVKEFRNAEGYRNARYEQAELDYFDNPELSFEISDMKQPLEAFIAYIENKYCGWKFSRTESRYESCIMAIFVQR